MAMVPEFATSPAARRKLRALVGSGSGQSAVVQLLLGDAIGDAFGFGIEMQDAYWIRQAITKCNAWPTNPVMKESHKVNNVRGMYSDDCEMTVAVMNALTKAVDVKEVSEAHLMEAWTDEWNLAAQRAPPAEPQGERAGHGSIKAFFNGTVTLEALKASQAEREDPGNAPPMRALPLAFLAPEDCERLCAVNADATHPHPKARAASFLVAMAARYLIVEKGPQDLVLEVCLKRLRDSSLSHLVTEEYLEAVQQLPNYHRFGRHLCDMPKEVHEVLCGPQPNPQLSHCLGGADGSDAVHGVGSDAMRTAGVVLYLLRFHRGPRDVLLTSVHIGGDVDSVAALCLAVVAGLEGLQFGQPRGLPWKLLEELEGVAYLVSRAKKFDAWLKTRGLRPPRPAVRTAAGKAKARPKAVRRPAKKA